MELQLLMSPSGLGKTHYIIEDIEKERHNSKIIVLTPEQNSYNFEKLLCDRFGGTFNIDVMNFTSLTRNINKLFLGNSSEIITDDIKLFYLYKAAKNLQASDNFLVKRILQDTNFIPVVQDIIKELKQYNIDFDRLESYIDENNNINKEKLSAILELYIEYTIQLKTLKTRDKEDYINETLFYLQYVDLTDYVFYIDAYYNFTAQEFSYIEKLVEKSKKVVISVISDANKYFNVKLEQLADGYEIENINYNYFYLKDLYTNDKYKLDIFRKSHEIVASINGIVARLKNIKFSVMAIVNSKKNTILNFKINKQGKVEEYELQTNDYCRYLGTDNKTLATTYYKAFKSEISDYDGSIEIIEAYDKELEMKQVAREIIKIKNNYNLTNKDIAILYRDSTYENYVNILEDYNISVHLDKDSDVSSHRLIKFLTYCLSFNDYQFKENIIAVLKTQLTDFENKYKDYVLKAVFFANENLTKTQFNKKIGELDKDYIRKKLLEEKNKKLINVNNIVNYSIEEVEKNINFITLEEVEFILNNKLITNYESLLHENFTKETTTYNSSQLEICREIIVDLHENIVSIFKNKNNKIKSYIKKIDSLLVYCNIKMLLDKEDGDYDNIEELKLDSIDRQVYKKLLIILDNISTNFGEDKIHYSDFLNLLLMSLEKMKYRSVPEIDNSLIMSSLDLAKVENKSVVFLVGFNKDALPISRGETLLDDSDKQYFINSGIFLSPTKQMSLIDEEFVAYIGLTRARLKTYISYSKINKSYKEEFPSPYLSIVKKILPKVKVKEIDKILTFDTTDYTYYFDNIDKVYTIKEFNYLFVKVYRRWMEIKDSNTQEEVILWELLMNFIKKYNEFNDNINVVNNYEVQRNLTDKIYIEKTKNTVGSFLDKIFKKYKFELSDQSINKFFQNKEQGFSTFSASKLGDYERNPYLFFVKRVLGIKEEMELDINPLVVGKFFHAIMADSSIVHYIKSKGEIVATFEKDYDNYLDKLNVRDKILEVIEESEHPDVIELLDIVQLAGTKRYILNNLISRLENAIRVEIKYVALTSSEFKFLEEKFDLQITKNSISCVNKKTGKSLIKKLEKNYNIPTIKFTGTIDRIDENNGKIIIVDYKSSKTDFDLYEINSGFISQILTYSLAVELMFGKKADDILGIFYREIAKVGKNLLDFRLRGIVNEDIMLQSELKDNSKDTMYFRITAKGKVHAGDAIRSYTTPQLAKLQDVNIDNMMTLIEKIYSFDFSLADYEIEDEKLAEFETLYQYAIKGDTRVKKKEDEVIDKKLIKNIVLNKL